MELPFSTLAAPHTDDDPYMSPPRLLNLINDFVLLRFRARAPEDLSAIEVIFLLLLLY